jgi:hypothetical protein
LWRDWRSELPVKWGGVRVCEGKRGEGEGEERGHEKDGEKERKKRRTADVLLVDKDGRNSALAGLVAEVGLFSYLF